VEFDDVLLNCEMMLILCFGSWNIVCEIFYVPLPFSKLRLVINFRILPLWETGFLFTVTLISYLIYFNLHEDEGDTLP